MAKYHDNYERVTWANGVTALSAEHMNNIEDGIEDLIEYKVEKETGKGLYPDTDKTKLAGIEAGAQVNRTYTAVTGKPTAAASPGFGGTFTVSQVVQNANGQVSVTDRVITIPSADATPSAHGLMSAADKTKLDGIQAGAQVNPGAATTSAAGLMSAADKTKLNGISSNANKVVTKDFTASGSYECSANMYFSIEWDIPVTNVAQVVGVSDMDFSATGGVACIAKYYLRTASGLVKLHVDLLAITNLTFTKFSARVSYIA